MSSTLQQKYDGNVILLLEILQNEERNVYATHEKVRHDLAEISVLEDRIRRIKEALKILEYKQ
ncbi:MAG: hypothetical protein WB588_01490 [Dehalococcoidia bacterium]